MMSYTAKDTSLPYLYGPSDVPYIPKLPLSVDQQMLETLVRIETLLARIEENTRWKKHK